MIIAACRDKISVRFFLLWRTEMVLEGPISGMLDKVEVAAQSVRKGFRFLKTNIFGAKQKISTSCCSVKL